jgi:hypothetical protein
VSSSGASSNNNNSEDEVFTLQIKGRKNYEILRHIRDAFEVQSAISKLKKMVSNERTMVDAKTSSSCSTGSSPEKRKNSSLSSTDNSTASLEE